MEVGITDYIQCQAENATLTSETTLGQRIFLKQRWPWQQAFTIWWQYISLIYKVLIGANGYQAFLQQEDKKSLDQILNSRFLKEKGIPESNSFWNTRVPRRCCWQFCDQSSSQILVG